MRLFIMSLACSSTMVCGSWASAQTGANVLGRASDAVERAAGETQNAVQDTANAVGNRLGVSGSANTQLNSGAAQFNGYNAANMNGNNLNGNFVAPGYGNQQVYAGPQSYSNQQVYGNQSYGNQSYGNQSCCGQQTSPRTAGYAMQKASVTQGGYGMSQCGSCCGMQSANGMTQGGVYMLQHDASGREFIYVSGQRIYFDPQESNNTGQGGSMQSKGNDNNNNMDQNGSSQNQNGQNQNDQGSSNSGDAPPTPAATTSNGAESSSAPGNVEAEAGNGNVEANADGNSDA